MNTRFLYFISIVAAILSLSSFYVGSRLIAAFPWAASHREAVWLSFALFVALQFLGPYLYRVFPDHVNRLFIVHWVTYTTLGVFGSVLLYSIAADLLVGLWTLLSLPGDAEALAFPAVLAMVLVTAVIGYAQVLAGPRVYEVDVPLRGLPEAFAGFRIVQITDLHLGPTLGRRFTEKVVRIANALAPDVVALTGDFVDGEVASLRGAVEPLSQLRAPHGTFFISGNHEYYWGVAAWLEEFRRLGARLLLNGHAVLRKDGSELVLAGVTDQAPDPESSLRGAPAGAVKLLLAHHPENYKEAARTGFQLQLSGHTHGGQFFPFSLLVRLTHRYYKGLHRFEDLWIYVSRGTGYWGPPLRFGVPAEITLIRLTTAASTATSSAAA